MTVDIPQLVGHSGHATAIIAAVYTIAIVIAAVTAVAAPTDKRRRAALKVLEILLRRRNGR